MARTNSLAGGHSRLGGGHSRTVPAQPALAAAVPAPPVAPVMWPRLSGPQDLLDVEAVPLSERDLPASTFTALERAARRWPDDPAVTFLPAAERYREGRTHNYAGLLADVRRTANALTGAGVRRRSTVGLLGPNNIELLTALLAAQAAGTAVPVNPALGDPHLLEILGRAGVKVLVAAGPEVDATLWDTARRIAPRLGATLLALRPTNASGPAPALEPVQGCDLAYLSERSQVQPSGRLLAPPPAATDLATLFHTGGTTGTPKLAAHTHANEISDAWMLAAGSTLPDEAVVFAALPLFHVNALVVTVLGPLLRGRHVVWAGPLGYREPALYRVLWNIVEHYGLSTLSGVPTVYSALADVPVTADISTLRWAAVGASPLPPAVRTAFESRTGVELLEGYGLTEATCASARHFPGRPRHGSVGQRLPYQQVKTVRQDAAGSWTDQPVGASGLLVLSGPNIFAGYVVGHDTGGPVLDQLGTVRDGWLDTGDIGRVDAEGYIHLTGRAKDVIIRGGHNIDPAGVEDTLLAHPDVTGANAVGRPDAHAGEVPVVYVTVKPDGRATADELQRWAGEHAREAAASPKEVLIVQALPLTDVGKPYKLPLRMDAARREAEAALERAGLGDLQLEVAAVDGAPVVTVYDTDHASRIARALAPYTFVWRLTGASPSGTGTQREVNS